MTTVSSEPASVPPSRPPSGEDWFLPALGNGRRRIAARVLDAAATLVAVMLPQLLLVAVVLGLDPTFEAVTAATLAGLAVMAVVYVALRVGLVVRWGCTVGQRIAGLRVVMFDDDLSRPGWKAAFSRHRPTWGSHVSPGTGPWSELLAYRRDPRTRRCLHDRMAGTLVVRAAEDEPVVRAVLAAAIPAGALVLALGFLAL